MASAPGIDYPTFSEAELGRRRAALFREAEEAGCDSIVVVGANREGSAIGWLTRWPVTREAALIMGKDEADILLIQHYNHVPNARRIASSVTVEWGGPSTVGSALDILARRGARGRVGVVGSLDYKTFTALVDGVEGLVDLNSAYTRLRLIKSAEEIEFLRLAASLTDRAVHALVGCSPGTSENELIDVIERSYVPLGASTHIHYLGLTSMDDPDRCVPSQFPSERSLRIGDALTVELSASYWEYAGQVLRTFSVGREPTALYRELHDVADAAFGAITAVIRPGIHVNEVIEAASVIEDSGFTIYDDLVHGFGGGYLPPVLGSKSRLIHGIPEMTFEKGMTVVVQPNVITPDERAGVQTGEMILVTDEGIQRLHAAPQGLLRIA